METIHVQTASKSYPIYIGQDLLAQTGMFLRQTGFSGKVVVVTDDNVAPLYLSTLLEVLAESGYEHGSITIPNGEAHKTMDTVLMIYQALNSQGITRGDLLLALGGGVVGDITGFAAATYLRGIRYAQIPTTLLAQVDSSIGGKTGVDLPFGKNLVGAFKQPELVVADISTVRTLTAEQVASGMAEVIKSAMIRSRALIQTLLDSKNLEDDLESIVKQTILIKKEVVEQDEFEQHQRMLLNFGHTLGHAIEKLMHYTGITHGQAVAIGMCLITKTPEVHALLEQLLHKYHLQTETGLPINKLIDAAKNDKKATSDGINIVVVRTPGAGEIEKISFEEFGEQYGA